MMLDLELVKEEIWITLYTVVKGRLYWLRLFHDVQCQQGYQTPVLQQEMHCKRETVRNFWLL